jgi:pimeloyl-ACP methyl ester carboxylesterase
MKNQVFRIDSDGFNGAWYPAPGKSGRGLIIMLGDSSEDYMARTAAKWLNRQGIHAMAMSPDKKDYGHHSYPLERFGKAIAFMKAQGCEKLGVVGASTTGMLALLAASYYPELSLTIAISPSDFVMEGFYRDGKDGATERPGDNESSVSWQGQPLPYLPYAYRHPEYWQKIREESKAAFVDIIEKLGEMGAQGVILGCTEIGLLVQQADTSLPVFDTTQIHGVKAAMEAIGA